MMRLANRSLHNNEPAARDLMLLLLLLPLTMMMMMMAKQFIAVSS